MFALYTTRCNDVTSGDNATKSVSSNSHSGDDSHESVLTVPAEIATGVPLGFSIDAGGSVTKVIYRSKLDYVNGKPTGDKDVLRFRFCPNRKLGELVQFLKENCDVRVPSSTASSADEKPLLYLTGLHVREIADELQNTFNCRIKILSEMDLVANGVAHVVNKIPSLKQLQPFSIPSIQTALNNARSFIQGIKSLQEANISAYGEHKHSKDGFDVVAYVTKLMTIETKSLADELQGEPLTFPCLLVQCGSATNISVLYEDGKLGLGSYCPVAGKTFLSLGRVLTGAKSADELIEMASKGDWRKVDLTAGDMKKSSRSTLSESDWYSLMPDFVDVFCLGRLSEEKYDGQYTKEDLAAGLLHMQCEALVHFVYETAANSKTRSILFNGSFVQWPTARHLLQECFLTWSLLMPVLSQNELVMHVLPHSGFIPTLGAWHRNLQQTSGEQTVEQL